MRTRPWDEIAAFLAEVNTETGRFVHLHELLRSIETSGVADALSAGTSMHDLIVVPTPPDWPIRQAIVVRAPGSLRQGPTGTVVIEHLTESGHDERIVRPAAETVPLFWRFVVEKYGIRPAQNSA